ncbi:MAG: alpha/beta fold hydrolase [Actinomycetota bacterium]|nr:alpha/beta fold hydrolase [Actinomycetota bacterium]
MWEPQRRALAAHEIFAPHLYRLGNSMDAWAQHVLEHVDGELAVVGASMGGYCALAIARAEPARVRALVLVGSRPDADSDERRASRDETIALIRRDGAAGLWELLRPKLFSGEAPPEVVARAREIAGEQDPGGLVAALEAIRDRADSTDVADALGSRLLLVVGERDPFVPVADARRLAHDRLHVIAGAGHLPSLERPDELNAVLTEFLARWT